MLPVMGSMAQSRSVNLDVEITSVPGDNLAGQTFTVTQTDFSVSYGASTLDADGKCHIKIYPGNHLLELKRNGFAPLVHEFTATEGEDLNLKLALQEATRDPYALQAEAIHNALTGQDDIALEWNTEQPAFFDDFEDYDAFAIQFGDWTGIDADGETTAPLVGNYPNRGVLQYAQIINPLTVTPTWWYDYPVLRPCSGQQYAGFIRTSSGAANDDWLISPEITVGINNELSFMAKAADAYPERFMVYVTTKTDNPTVDDFIRIDTGNYESVDYKAWKEFRYDLSQYEGRKIKFAIRYIGDANRFGAFMLMIDDVFVGQPALPDQEQKARRVKRSPENANETFEIYLDGEKVGTTDSYSYLIQDVKGGDHTVGVRAVYLAAQSGTTTVDVAVATGKYSRLTLNVTADSKLGTDGQTVSLLGLSDAMTYTQTVRDGKAEWKSLPNGRYDISTDEGAFEAYLSTVDVASDMDCNVVLADNMITPYNITAVCDEESNVSVKWNRALLFSDSFEEYEDFAHGEFGDWITLDRDGLPVYPIGLGSASNIVSFPGSGTATNPMPLAPLVFNPWNTVPAMLPTDQAIAAPTGEKMIMFNSAQGGQSDKWLISPLQEIRDGYVVKFLAKAYSIYPETMQILVSDGSTTPEDFTVIAEIDEMISSAWGEYTVSLEEYAGKSIRIALRYTSFDAFLAQVDDFTVGPESGEGDTVDYGNVVRYQVYLDDVLVGEPEESELVIPAVEGGEHTLGICAVYKNGVSEKGYYTFNVVSSVDEIPDRDLTDNGEPEYYDLLGRKTASPVSKGIYIRRTAGNAVKIMK